MNQQASMAATGRAAQTGDPALLRLALKLDALVSGAVGVAYIAGAGVLDGTLGLPAVFLISVGAFQVVLLADAHAANVLGDGGRVQVHGAVAGAQEAGVAGRHGAFEIRPGRLPDDIPFAPGSFDIVAALDVLEHVDDDRAALQSLCAQLQPGGLLLLTVPAFPFLWGRHD